MPDPTPRVVRPLAAPVDRALAEHRPQTRRDGSDRTHAVGCVCGASTCDYGLYRDHLRDVILAEIEAEYGPLTDLLGERQRQDAKWGEQNHAPSVWLAILGEEVGELAEAILFDYSGGDERNHTHSESMRTEAAQIAAVAVAFIEYLDRRAES